MFSPNSPAASNQSISKKATPSSSHAEKQCSFASPNKCAIQTSNSTKYKHFPSSKIISFSLIDKKRTFFGSREQPSTNQEGAVKFYEKRLIGYVSNNIDKIELTIKKDILQLNCLM